MANTRELIDNLLSFAVGFWPILFPVALYAFLKHRHRRGFWSLLKHMFTYMTSVWFVFATMWLGLLYLGGHPFPLVAEPANSKIFWGIGAVIVLVWLLSFSIDWLKRRRSFEKAQELSSLHSLSPGEFEELVAEAYRRMGHKVRVVGTTGDHGVDLRIRAKNGENWIVQCKRYQGSVGEPIVRDLYGTMLHEKADRAAIVTSGTITRQAEEWVEGKPIGLYDGATFLKILRKLQKTNPT